MPQIDIDRLHAYRMGRIKTCLRESGAAMCILVNPISLRYAVDYRNYGLFQSHIPSTHLFVPLDGPVVMYGAYGLVPLVDDIRPHRNIAYFDGGPEIGEAAKLFADDVLAYLNEIGADNRRVAVEYVNPSVTQSLMAHGLEVIDAVAISEKARLIKSGDEIACMRWAIAVAEHGINKVEQALKPGVSEVQLWGLLNYTSLANQAEWHEGHMLASGPRINPWLQEATDRLVESGDLVGLDTDMVGPMGYFADISRTFHCGPKSATRRQKELYQLAMSEIEYNLKLVRGGITLREFQQKAFVPAEEFHQNAYPCIIHGVGMCDEYPKVEPAFPGSQPADVLLEAGMVICVESYMGAVGERDGVKLEQQVLVTEDGYEMLTSYPFDKKLMG